MQNLIKVQKVQLKFSVDNKTEEGVVMVGMIMQSEWERWNLHKRWMESFI